MDGFKGTKEGYTAPPAPSLNSTAEVLYNLSSSQERSHSNEVRVVNCRLQTPPPPPPVVQKPNQLASLEALKVATAVVAICGPWFGTTDSWWCWNYILIWVFLLKQKKKPGHMTKNRWGMGSSEKSCDLLLKGNAFLTLVWLFVCFFYIRNCQILIVCGELTQRNMIQKSINFVRYFYIYFNR